MLIFHSYHLDDRPDGYLIIDEVLQKTAPSPAFELATDPMRLLALTTYYFMRKNLAFNYKLILTPQLDNVLRSMGSKPKLKPSNVVTLRVQPPILKFLNKPKGCQTERCSQPRGLQVIGATSLELTSSTRTELVHDQIPVCISQLLILRLLSLPL